MRESGNTLFERDDITDRMAEITCPAIVFHGTEDRSVEMELAEDLSERLPGCIGLVRGRGRRARLQPDPSRRGQRADAGVPALALGVVHAGQSSNSSVSQGAAASAGRSEASSS